MIIKNSRKTQKGPAFKEICGHADWLSLLLKKCTIIDSLVRSRYKRIQTEVFMRIKKRKADRENQVYRGLSKLMGLFFSRNSAQAISFMNDLELLASGYEQIVSRLRATQWKSKLNLASVFDLNRSYIRALWMKQDQKYEYTQDLVEKNNHIFFLLLDDLVCSQLEKAARVNLVFSLTKMKLCQSTRVRKLERLFGILSKYHKKQAKNELLEVIHKTTATKSKEKFFRLLHRMFAFHTTANLKEAFHRISIVYERWFFRLRCIRRGLGLLKGISVEKKQQVFQAMLYRGFFKIRSSPTRDSRFDLAKSLKRVFIERLRRAFNQTKSFNYEFRTKLEEKFDLLRTEPTQNTIQPNCVSILVRNLDIRVLKTLGISFRSIILRSRTRNSFREKVLRGLSTLFIRNLIAGFNSIKNEADHVHGRRMISCREGLYLLDTVFKNKINEGRALL